MAFWLGLSRFLNRGSLHKLAVGVEGLGFPAEILDEEIGEGECLEAGAGGLRVELGGHG